MKYILIALSLLTTACDRTIDDGGNNVLYEGELYYVEHNRLDRGSCCPTRDVISIVDTSSDLLYVPSEIADIKGANIVKVNWKDERNLLLVVCNASRIEYIPYIPSRNFSSGLIVEVESQHHNSGEDCDV